MTQLRSIAILCFCFFLFSVMAGQRPGSPADSITLSPEQLIIPESPLADSTGSELNIPNVFTPNGDQINDFFEVKTDGSTVYELTIFTRTGTRVFYSLSPRIFWDGTASGGIELPQGIYYYVIEDTGDSDPFKAAGFMHLFR